MEILWGSDDYDYRVATTTDKNVKAYEGAFGNCQNFVINNFQDLLFLGPSELTHFLCEVCKNWGRLYCIIDITDDTYDNLKKIIHQKSINIEFVVESAYENANGSDMVLCILDLTNLEKI